MDFSIKEFQMRYYCTRVGQKMEQFVDSVVICEFWIKRISFLDSKIGLFIFGDNMTLVPRIKKIRYEFVDLIIIVRQINNLRILNSIGKNHVTHWMNYK